MLIIDLQSYFVILRNILQQNRGIFQDCIAVSIMAIFILPRTIFSLNTRFAYIRYQPMDWHAFALVSIAGIIIIYWYWRRIHANDMEIPTMCLYWLLVVFLTYLLASIYYSYHEIVSCNIVTSFLYHVEVGLFTVLICRSVRKVGVILSLLAGVQACYAFTYFIIGKNVLISGTIVRAGGTFNQPNPLSMLMMLAIPIAMTSLRTNGLTRYFNLFVISMMLIGLIITGQRAALMAELCSLLVSAAFLGYRPRYLIAILVVLTLLTPIIFITRQTGLRNAISSEQSISTRKRLACEGITLFQQHWFVGVGLGRIRLPLDFMMNRNMIHAELLSTKCTWLDCIVESGIVGAIWMLFILINILRIIQSTRTQIGYAIGVAWTAIFIAGIADSLFCTTIFPVQNVLLGILLGMTLILSPTDMEHGNS